MSKEIFINTGTSFQQQYIARQPAIGTAPVTAQYDAQGNANARTPFTYQNRSPYTFRSPVSNQTPYIANKQNPYPYIANSQTPYPANKQNPYPYIANGRQSYPYIANAQQPYPYIASSQTPYPANKQNPTPYTYQANARQPNIENAQQPYPYIADKQTPSIENRQTPYPARQPVNVQSAYQQRQPNQTRSPAPARQPVNVQTPLGSGIQHTKNDHTTGGSQSAQLNAMDSDSGYIENRYLRMTWRVHWHFHSNGYGYAYFYVRRGTVANELYVQQAASLVYLSTGNVAYNTSNWRLVEQWSFWNNILPDSLSLGSLSPTATTGSLPLSCTTGSNTTNSYEGYKQQWWYCEEGFGGGTKAGTYYAYPTAIKSGYNNLVGGTHGTTYEGDMSCTWGGGCFVAGTKVLLEDNTTKNIEDMEVGDTVIGKDGIVNAVKSLMTIQVPHENGNINTKAMYTVNGDLVVSGGHPIFTTTGWKSCNASEGQELHPELNITELAVGDKVLKDIGNANGDTEEVEVSTLTVETHDDITIYNLDVTDSPEGNDTYVANNYIVHNK